MTPPTTAEALRRIADALEAIPGLPPAEVSVYSHGTVSVMFLHHADEIARSTAVDMLAAVISLDPAKSYEIDARPWYGTEGTVGGLHIEICAPDCTVVRLAPVSA